MGQAGIMSTINAQGVQGSVMIPSVNMVNHMGMMGGGIMPINMMSGMPGMTSTPLLLPQVNGPTLLVNVPNYMAYQGIPNMGGMPNMVMQGIFGPQIATISSMASIPQVVVPSQVITTTTPSSLPTVVSTIQSSMSSTLVSSTPTASTSVNALPSMVEKTELKDEKKTEQIDLYSNTNEPALEELSPRVSISEFLQESPVPGPSNIFKNEEKIENNEECDEEMELSDIEEDKLLEKDETEYIENKGNDMEEDDLNISQEILLDAPSHESEHPQDFNISPLPSLVSPPDRQRQTSVISHVTPSKRPRILSGSNQVSAIISPRSVNAVQDSLLGSIQEDITSSLIPTTSSTTTESSLSMSQFGSENPQLPQLTLNFPSILMMDKWTGNSQTVTKFLMNLRSVQIQTNSIELSQ